MRVSVLLPVDRLAAEAPTTLLGAQTLRVQAHRHGYHEGPDGHLTPSWRGCKAEDSHQPLPTLPYGHLQELLLLPQGRQSPWGGELPQAGSSCSSLRDTLT